MRARESRSPRRRPLARCLTCAPFSTGSPISRATAPSCHIRTPTIFRSPKKDIRIAKAERERPFPSLEQVSCLQSMPAATEIESVTGRDRVDPFDRGPRRALASLKLKHIDLARNADPGCPRREDEIQQEFPSCFSRRRRGRRHSHRMGRLSANRELFGPETSVPKDGGRGRASSPFRGGRLSREFWSDAASIRKIFKASFERAGLPYYNPHAIRKP